MKMKLLLERAVLALPIPFPLPEQTYYRTSFIAVLLLYLKHFPLSEWEHSKQTPFFLSCHSGDGIIWVCFSWLLNFPLIFRNLSLQHSRYGMAPWKRGRKTKGIYCQSSPPSLLLPSPCAAPAPAPEQPWGGFPSPQPPWMRLWKSLSLTHST